MRSTKPLIAFLTIFSFIFVSRPLPILADDTIITSADQAREMLLSLKVDRWANATWVEQLTPFYTTTSKRSARLLILSRFEDPVTVEVMAISRRGSHFDLGSHVIAARESVTVELNEELSKRAGEFIEGAVQIRFFGDTQMIQGWLIISDLSGTTEIALEDPELTTAGARYSSWTAHSAGDAMPRIFLFNASRSAVAVNLAVGSDIGGYRTQWTEEIPSRRPYEISPNQVGAETGKLRIVFPENTQLIATVFHDEPGTLMRLPLATSPLEGSEYDSLLLPEEVAGDMLELQLLDTRTAGRPVPISVSLVSFATGDTAVTYPIMLSAGAVSTVDLRAKDKMAPSGNLARVRLHVALKNGGVLPSLRYRTADGVNIHQPLFERQDVHSNGLYPIPNIQLNDVTTTIVNLGHEEAQVVGHLTWDTGQYSLGPFQLPAGAGRQIVFAELAQAEKKDILNRRLVPSFEQGFFQWTSNRGSKELIARTEISPHGASRRFGFSCYGCCSEIPSGAVIPEGVTFDIGQNPSFEGIEFVHTCTGTIGPYVVSVPDVMTYQAPLSWDGHSLSASDLTAQNVSFQETGAYLWINCDDRTRTFLGDGDTMVDKCHEQYAEGIDPAKGCFDPENSNSCSSCYSCCDKVRAAGDCRCKGNQVCKNGVQAACGTCKQRCFGEYNTSCNQQITSCQ